MIPMMMMQMRPTARIKATRSWNQTEYADRGETISCNALYIKEENAKGFFVRDIHGNVITDYDDTAMTTEELSNTIVDIPWQDWWDFGLFEDDVCHAFLGIETNRPSAANGGYEYHMKYQIPYDGRWRSLYFATELKQFRPYRAATGSNRIVDIHEIDGDCTLTMIDPVDGDCETLEAAMLTDSDDLASRPTCQTGTVAMHAGTIDTTTNTTLRLAGHINEPIAEALKVGGPASQAYDPTGVRTRWNDGKTWTVPYIATCFKYGTNYYGIEYSESNELKLKAVPIYDYLTKQAGFMDEASPTNRLIFSQGRRPFKPVWDDGFVIPEEEGA